MRPRKSNIRQRGGTAFVYLYRAARWQRLRKAQLESEPLCVYCMAQGYAVLATVCDHIKGHPSGETEQQFWSGPFQSLCQRCHNGAKQELEQRGTLRGGDVSGMPLDRNHHWNAVG